MASLEQGARDLELVGKRLKAQGRGDLRKELLKGIRTEAKPAVADVKASARANLPQRGGLAAIVGGSSFGVRTRLTGNSAGVRITGTSRSVKGMRAINAGRLRHPVFGNRKTWAEQHVEPGFFSEPIERRAPQIRGGIERVMKRIANDVERGI